MHGCNGIWEWDKVWTDRLVAWDYVVLNVDSLTPRGLTDICHGRDTITATPWIRALDAYGAMNHLATLRYVDPTRIAVVGMSLGGTAVLYTIEQSMTGGLQTKPFRAAVALYPSCRELQQVNTPTLILIGDKDNWTPASWCVRYLDQLKPPHDVTVKVFPGAHHIFDLEGLDAEEGGLTIRHHPQAAAEAIEMIKMFLKDRL